MKKTLSILLCVIMLISVFSVAFSSFAADIPLNGWYKDKNGKWHYSDWGEDIANDFYYDEIKDKFYYFDCNGVLIENSWTKVEIEYEEGLVYSAWIYSLKGGALAEGWKKLNGAWYYFSPAMYSNGGFYIDEDDAVYVFDKNGALTSKTGWVSYTEKTSDGQSTKYWYYVKKGGKAFVGWKKYKGDWYYFDKEGGEMLSIKLFPSLKTENGSRKKPAG